MFGPGELHLWPTATERRRNAPKRGGAGATMKGLHAELP
jgi:hypothetical protein